MNKELTLQELELLNTASAYNGEQHKAICSKAALELIEYKKIEEELGIDLITLFKAYSNGFYVKGEIEKQYIDFENSLNAIAFKNGEMFYGHKWSYQYIKLNEYGKTWALTKEELEDR